ncbi:hypothetical protein [Xylophilus sp.]|uniref:hypothetical protein n=1 Tax=Xylophilus sp. TaxID=2653893 RepID=UPI0013BCFA38|nr:hypothetical protein [Xylophilus sp.]KAF1046023.1 MAG: hypothetical protein GAK38_02726 [Xylophilus sp.]
MANRNTPGPQDAETDSDADKENDARDIGKLEEDADPDRNEVGEIQKRRQAGDQDRQENVNP